MTTIPSYQKQRVGNQTNIVTAIPGGHSNINNRLMILPDLSIQSPLHINKMHSTFSESKKNLYRSADKTKLPINQLHKDANDRMNSLCSQKTLKGGRGSPRESKASVGMNSTQRAFVSEGEKGNANPKQIIEEHPDEKRHETAADAQ